MEVLCENSYDTQQRVKSPINSNPNSTYSQTSWMCIFPNGPSSVHLYAYVCGGVFYNT